MTFWKPITLLLGMRYRAANNDFAANPTAFLGRGLLGLILALVGMSMNARLGRAWPQISRPVAELSLSRLVLQTQFFCLLGMLLPGAVSLLGHNPARSVRRAFPLRPVQGFVADMLACLLDAPAAIVAISIFPFLVQLILNDQWGQALALLVIVGLLGVLTCALVRLLIDGSALLARRTRKWAEIPALTGLLLVCLCGVVPPAFASLTTAPQQNPNVPHFHMPVLPPIDPTPLLPSTYACGIVLATRQGDLPGATSSLLLLVGMTGALVSLAFAASRAAERLFDGVGKQVRRVGSSTVRRDESDGTAGLFQLLATLIATELKLLIRKPESYLPIRPPAAMILLCVLGFLAPDMGKDPAYAFKELIGLGAVIYNVLWQMQLLCNRFGSEAGTGALLFSLSVPRWLLLLGKNVALLMMLLVLDSVGLAALCFIAEAPGNIPEFLCWQGLALILITSMGNIVSVFQPFSISKHENHHKEDAPEGLAAAYIAVGVAAGLLLWPMARLVRSSAWGAACGIGYALALYAVSLWVAAIMLKGNERRVIARLDRSGQ